MAKVILRAAKLKTRGNISASLSHSFRTRETPNADPGRMALNEFSHSGPDDLAAAIQDRLPEKFRKDAVRCLEYFVGASPEWFKPGQDGTRYFRDALDWLKKQHGPENLAGWAIHRDEKSPHLVAYFVPLDEGKLNAKRWTGGREKLSKMQTAFAQEVGRKHDLERGIEGSKAKHTTVKQFYAAISQEMKFTLPKAPKAPPPLAGLKRLSPPALQERVDFLAQALEAWQRRAAALQQVAEQAMARAKIFEQAKKEAEQAKKTAKEMQCLAQNFYRQGREGQKKGRAAQQLEKDLQEARHEVQTLKRDLGEVKHELRAQEGRMKQLTVGDVAVILGDEWARENGIRKGSTDPARIAPQEWQELAREKIRNEYPAPKKNQTWTPPSPGG